MTLLNSGKLWHSQWKLFAPNFREGKAHIELAPYGCPHILKLIPGPGFGDFSHPTTRLMLRLMAPHVKDQNVIDIGCGSGILSLAASLLGASSVYGYDIDVKAVSHARHNAQLNACSLSFESVPPLSTAPHSTILMNMIASEQEIAWRHFLPSLSSPAQLLTSGILDPTAYLRWTCGLGWKHVQSLQEKGWWGFEFSHL